MTSQQNEVIDEIVCTVDELKINEKKLVPFGSLKIIVIRESEEKFVAIGSACSHYGAPLINGFVHNGYISCPWHGACFNIHTGDIEEFPGCDSIPSYETYVKDGSVHVKSLKCNIVKKRVKLLAARNIVNRSTTIIIGGGPAGFQCSETLRQEGYDGRIVLISSESVPPYDRTKLSKSLTAKVEDILLRDESHYKKAGIELLLETFCSKLDTKSQVVHLEGGSTLRYDKLFISTGSNPRKYRTIPDNVNNALYLRTHEDALKIANNTKDKNVVLIGSSFIVMEIASYLNGKSKSISIISKSEVPFAHSLGQKIGNEIKNLCISKKVNFYVESDLKFIIENGSIKKVKLQSEELDVDVCIIGIGSEPNTQFLKDCDDIRMNRSFIEVDENFQTSVPNIYAGGDVVLYRNQLLGDEMRNIAHWQTAQIHGRHAALSMLGKSTTFKSVPFFWSMVFGKGVRFAGTIDDPKNCVIEGELEKFSFVAMYFDSKNKAIGVATMANDPIAPAFAAALRNGKVITKDQIENDGFKWLEEIVN